MAAPPTTPQEIATLIHNNSAGASVGGWTLASKTTVYLRGNRLMVAVVVTRGSGTWTGRYTTRNDGTIGKIYAVVDGNGRSWLPFILGSSWTDGGFR